MAQLNSVQFSNDFPGRASTSRTDDGTVMSIVFDGLGAEAFGNERLVIPKACNAEFVVTGDAGALVVVELRGFRTSSEHGSWNHMLCSANGKRLELPRVPDENWVAARALKLSAKGELRASITLLAQCLVANSNSMIVVDTVDLQVIDRP